MPWKEYKCFVAETRMLEIYVKARSVQEAVDKAEDKAPTLNYGLAPKGFECVDAFESSRR